jgi:hypothetical protein
MGVFPKADLLDPHTGVIVFACVISREFAKRSFGKALARKDEALDDDFGVGGDRQLGDIAHKDVYRPFGDAAVVVVLAFGFRKARCADKNGKRQIDELMSGMQIPPS